MKFPYAAVLCSILLGMLWSNASAQPESPLSVRGTLLSAKVQRCDRGCSSSRIRSLFSEVLLSCTQRRCASRILPRLTPLGTGNISQFFVICGFDKSFCVRFQADLLTNGARMVLVAIPANRVLETENFKRPFISGPLIPKRVLKFRSIDSFLDDYV